MRQKAPKWREIDYDSIIKIGVPKGGNPCDFVAEGSQLRNHGLLRLELLALAGKWADRCGLSQLAEPSLFVRELRDYVVVQDAVEGVSGDAMVVKPD